MFFSDVSTLLNTHKSIESVVGRTQAQFESQEYPLTCEFDYENLRDKTLNCGEQGMCTLEEKTYTASTALNELINVQKSELLNLEFKVEIANVLESWKRDNDAMARLDFSAQKRYRRVPIIESSVNPDPRWMRPSEGATNFYSELLPPDTPRPGSSAPLFSTLFFSDNRHRDRISPPLLHRKTTCSSRLNTRTGSRYRVMPNICSSIFTTEQRDIPHVYSQDEPPSENFPTPSDDEYTVRE